MFESVYESVYERVCESELWGYFITHMYVIIYSCPTHYIMGPIAVILIGADVSNRTVNDCHFYYFYRHQIRWL